MKSQIGYKEKHTIKNKHIVLIIIQNKTVITQITFMSIYKRV
jgi:hypothetical protein